MKTNVQGGKIMFVDSELPNIIELRNINQEYKSKAKVEVEVKGKKKFVTKEITTNIISDLDFLIEDKPNTGQYAVLLGKSGCGKSTILRYICGLQKPTSGEVMINGNLRTEADRIGIVMQHYSSFEWLTAVENVELALKYKGGVSKKDMREIAMNMLALVDLTDHANKYAKTPTMSGGQLQRVAIARSLVANPNIILLDEPFSGLDINTKLKMQDMLMGLYNNPQLNTTFIHVTHDISEAVYLADDIYVMSNNPGRIVNHVELNFQQKSKEIKRTREFTDAVHAIEDIMLTV